MFVPLLLSRRISLNLPVVGRQHGCQHARMQGEEVNGGEREAQAFVGKRNKGGKSKESNTYTPTSMGLLQLGPQRNYLTWRLAKPPRLSPSALVQNAVRAAGTVNTQGSGSMPHPKRKKEKKKKNRDRAGTEWAYFHTTAIVLLMRKGN